MARHKDAEWCLFDRPTNEQILMGLLMDLRDELKAMKNALQLLETRLRCPDTLAIPALLRRIAKNTTRRRRKRVTA